MKILSALIIAVVLFGCLSGTKPFNSQTMIDILECGSDTACFGNILKDKGYIRQSKDWNASFQSTIYLYTDRELTDTTTYYNGVVVGVPQDKKYESVIAMFRDEKQYNALLKSFSDAGFQSIGAKPSIPFPNVQYAKGRYEVLAYKEARSGQMGYSVMLTHK